MLIRSFSQLSASLLIALSASAGPAAAQEPAGFDAFFERLDGDDDGKLSKQELPESLQRNFGQIDLDQDGFASRQEMQAVFDRLRERDWSRSQARVPRIPAGVTHLADVPYAGTDNPRQALDLLLPEDRAEGDKPLPVVVFIHGGGWRAGHKNGGINRVLPFVRSGDYAGVSVGYRLSNEAQWPAQIHDCKAAIRWVRANAQQYNLDPERIAVWGTSAGGHLVAMLGTSGDVEHLEGDLGPHTDVSSRVTCVVDWFGPANFATMGRSANLDHDDPNSPESLLLGGPVRDNLDIAADASPQTWVSDDDPPMLILHGDRDPLVPVQQSIDFDEKLDAAGVASTLIVVKGAGHGFGGEEINQAVNTFIARHLRDAEGPALEDGEIQAPARQRR